MQKKAYILRHGETEWNHLGRYQGRLDSPLTEKGKMQAEHIAEVLQSKQIETIFSSPLSRAQTTASIIGRELHVPVTVIDAFAEMHYGVFEGKQKNVVEKEYAAFFLTRATSSSAKVHTPYPLGESYEDVYNRVNGPVRELVRNNSNFIILGHNSVNRVIRAAMTGKKLEDMVNIMQGNHEFIEIDLETGEELIHHIQVDLV